jgi:hypothetical protein
MSLIWVNALTMSVNGTITTDGNTGPLNEGDIQAWSLTISGLAPSPFTLNNGNSILYLGGNAVADGDLVATSNTLTWNYSDPLQAYLCFCDGAQAQVYFGTAGGDFPNLQLYIGYAPWYQNESYSGTQIIAEVTPLPTALPLFATGLGAIGLLGWRRKRKAAALAA